MTFLGWIFNRFSPYFRENDSYKNAQGEGFLQRYCKNFEQDLDEGIYPFVKNFMDLMDVFLVDSKYIPYLSYTLGSPISVVNDIATYRKILAYAVEIYKVKGTIESYRLLFNIFGLDVTIIEAVPKKAIRYDDNRLYDEDPPALYDEECENCSCYFIAYKPLNEPDNTQVIDLVVPQDIIDKVNNIICFIQPINAKLCGIYRKITFGDELPITLEDESDISLTAVLRTRLFFYSFANDIDLTVDPYDVIEEAYLQPSNEFDVDEMREEINGTPNGIITAYFVNHEGKVRKEIIYGMFYQDSASFIQTMIRWINEDKDDESLEFDDDTLWVVDPIQRAFAGLQVYTGAIQTVPIPLTRLDESPYPGCPNPTYPMAVFAEDDTYLGNANNQQEFADLWNNYYPNKKLGQLLPDEGCTFDLVISDGSVTPITSVKAEPIGVLGDFDPGDFNPDFDT